MRCYLLLCLVLLRLLPNFNFAMLRTSFETAPDSSRTGSYVISGGDQHDEPAVTTGPLWIPSELRITGLRDEESCLEAYALAAPLLIKLSLVIIRTELPAS